MDPTSRDIFFGEGVSDDALFDDYGAFGASISSSSTLTRLFTYIADATGTEDGVGSALVKRPGIDYQGSMLVVSRRQIDRSFLYEFTPDTNDWGSVTSSSQVTVTNRFYNDIGSVHNNSVETIGVAFFTDTTGTHCVGRGLIAQISDTTNSAPTANHIYKHYTVNDSDTGFTRGAYSFGVTSQRYPAATSSCENLYVAGSKDQNGSNFSTSGQGTMLLASSLSTGSNPSSGNIKRAFNFIQNNNQNSHGHLDRVGFFGGVRNSSGHTEGWYMCRYNNWQNGADGYKLTKITCSDNNGTPTQAFVGNHRGVTMSSSGGFYVPSNSIYPYGLVYFRDAQYQINSNLGAKVYYLDLSSVSSNTSATEISFPTQANNPVIAASFIGYQNNKLLLAYVAGSTLTISEYTPGSTSSGTVIKSVTLVQGNTVSGIWPVPNTDRIIVGHQAGISLLKLTP